MLVLGIESSCDETGIGLYDRQKGLLAQALFSQVEIHRVYGGVVPELASRDHILKVVPLIRQVMRMAQKDWPDLSGVAYTKGPGLSGALLVGASIANGLAMALGLPVVGVHHLEGHLLSPLLAEPKPDFPFLALLVSGGHTQLIRVERWGSYQLVGDTLDDAAGEAFDKSAKLLGLAYPGGPAISELATLGDPEYFKLPRPMLKSNNLQMSFSGLKTAVWTIAKEYLARGGAVDPIWRAHLAASVQAAVVDTLVVKALAALQQEKLDKLVVAGGVGANRMLRERLNQQAKRDGFAAFYPPLEYCTDNGAMIALVGAYRLPKTGCTNYDFSVRPRWDLMELQPI